jgi:hypothetical protein
MPHHQEGFEYPQLQDTTAYRLHPGSAQPQKHRSVYVDMVLMKRVMFSTASTHTFALYLIDLLLSVVTAPL